MSKEDWIILRVTRAALQADPNTRNHADIVKAMLYLVKKYGRHKLAHAITQLFKEEITQ